MYTHTDENVTEYVTKLVAQRQARAQDLLKDVGFFTLAGFFWLKEGDNSFGTDLTNDIVLPAESAPGYAGLIRLGEGQTTVQVAPGVNVTTGDGASVTSMTLRPDQSGTPDVIYLGNLTMLILQRGEQFALRLYDKEHAARQHFSGLRWYPIQPAYRIVADFVPYNPPKVLPIVEVIGYAYEAPSPGYARFIWAGREYQLDAQTRGNRLFYNFRDATNGDSTYGAGRFLYGELPQDGTVVLDFNQATNPFCAYTPFATCPLPPPQNRLDFRVEAGEMIYQAVPLSAD
jgi:uncharacterized protein (DUF1684 family)